MSVHHIKHGKYGGYCTIGEIYVTDGVRSESHNTSQYEGGEANVSFSYEPTSGRRNWRKIIKQRDSATTWMSVSGLSYKGGQIGSMAVDWELDPDWGKQTYQSFAVGHFVDPADCIPGDLDWTSYDDVVNQALMKFITRARSVQGSFQGGVFLGELRETIHQIRHPAGAIRSLLSDYLGAVKKRSGKVARLNGRVVSNGSIGERSRVARNTLQSMISDTWLEFQFGVKPLVNDVIDAAQALARYNIDDFPSKVVTGKSRYSQELGDNFITRSLGTGQLVTRIRKTSSVQVKIYGCVKVQCSAGASHAAALAGLTWRDFAPTVWELIPYSFLVDYFTNVGAIVEAASFNTASVAWANIGVYVRSVSEQVEQRFSPFTSPNGHYIRTGSGLTPSGPIRLERFVKTRQKYIGGYMPSLAFKIPGVHQSLNISALIGQSQALSRRLARRG